MKPTILQMNRFLNVLAGCADIVVLVLENGERGRGTRTRMIGLARAIACWALVALLAAGAFPARAQGTNRVNLNDFSAFKLITDRNIFDPNRRPSRVSTPLTERAAVDSFSLAGTMSYSNVLVAIFDGSKMDYHKVLKTAEQVAGYAVTDIGYNAVKLSSGTNQVELKVGMQMRRSADGKWSVSESSGSYGSTNAASSRRGSSDRREAASSGRSPANAYRSTGEPDGQSNTNLGSDLTGGPAADLPPGPEMDGAPGAAPPDAGGGNADDPVTRMMQRRQQETGGNAAESEN